MGFGAELPVEIVEIFRRQCESRHQQKFGALAAAVKLWTELRVEIQARLLDQSLNGSAFIELVQQIVDERMLEGYKDGKALRKRLERMEKAKRLADKEKKGA